MVFLGVLFPMLNMEITIDILTYFDIYTKQTFLISHSLLSYLCNLIKWLQQRNKNWCLEMRRKMYSEKCSQNRNDRNISYEFSKAKCNRILTLLLPDKMIFKVKYALCWHSIYYIGSSDGNVNWILFASRSESDCPDVCACICVFVCDYANGIQHTALCFNASC